MDKMKRGLEKLKLQSERDIEEFNVIENYLQNNWHNNLIYYFISIN